MRPTKPPLTAPPYPFSPICAIIYSIMNKARLTIAGSAHRWTGRRGHIHQYPSPAMWQPPDLPDPSVRQVVLCYDVSQLWRCKMGFLDAAEQVLKQEGQPLHCDEITRRATAPDSHSLPPSASLSCFPFRPPCAILSKTRYRNEARAVPHAFCRIVDARAQNAFPLMGHAGSGGAPPAYHAPYSGAARGLLAHRRHRPRCPFVGQAIGTDWQYVLQCTT